MSPEQAVAFQALLDREAIRECLYRYCRGIDRCDEQALRATYWPDATDRHGPYQGSATGFCDWAVDKLKTAGRMIHLIGNIMIDLQGDQAAVESYFHAIQGERNAQGQPIETFLCGRYADRFEKRGGEWRVAARTVIYDWVRQTPMPDQPDAQLFGVRQPQGGRKPDDAIYLLLDAVKEPTP